MIRLTDVSKYYRSNQNVTLGLHKINLEFHPGEFAVITGESGSGKSTLLNVISGSDSYDEGEMYIEGQETSCYDKADWEQYRREKISFIYQNYNLIDSFTVLQNVKSALLIRIPQMDEKEADRKALEYIRKVGLEKQAKKKASHLSSGQKQRLSIARALAKETEIIVADEPTGNLDAQNSKEVVQLLSELSKDRLVIMATHNYDEVGQFATRKIRMYDGEVAEDIRLREAAPVEKKDVKEEKHGRQDARRIKKEQKVLAKRMIHMIRGAKPHNLMVLIVLFLFLSVSIYIFFGAFKQSLDFSTAKNYSDKTYVKKERTRISVRKSDGSSVTGEDAEKLKKLNYVTSVDLYDVVNDIIYAENMGEDYTCSERAAGGVGEQLPKTQVVIQNEGKMLRTVTALGSGVKEGDMPQAWNEIVVNSDDAALIGTEKKFYVWRKYNWQKNSICVNAVITGITDQGESGQIYISETMAKVLNVTAKRLDNYMFYGVYGAEQDVKGLCETSVTPEMITSENKLQQYSREEQENPIFIPNNELSGNEILLSDNFYCDAYITVSQQGVFQKPVQDTAYLFWGAASARQQKVLQVLEGMTEHGSSVIEISQELFDEIYPEQDSHQLSVYIRDYAYMDRVLKKIEGAGYQAVSTFRAGSTDYNEDKMQQQTGRMLFSFGALVTIFVVGLLLIALIMNFRKKDYQILMLMGLGRREADLMNRIDIIENGITALAGTLLFVFVADRTNLPFVAGAVRYYDVPGYLLYLLIMGAMFILLTRKVRLEKRRKKGRGKEKTDD